MIKVIDTPRINRYAMFANGASIGGLMLLLVSVLIPLFISAIAHYAWILTIIGAIIAMVGIYFANRWVRKPRPEDQIDKACKGLADNYTVFHYPKMPIDHILLTPYGIQIIESIGYQGFFYYRDGKWKEAMSMGRAIRFIVEEHLGNPSNLLASEISFLKAKLQGADLPEVPVKGLVVFTHPAAQLELKNPPVPACQVKKLRKYIETKGTKIAPEALEQIKNYLEAQTFIT